MNRDDFAGKLLPKLSLDEIEFAYDMERVLAEQVKYLRGLVATLTDGQALKRDLLIAELRSRLAEKDRDISRLQAENDWLREILLGSIA